MNAAVERSRIEGEIIAPPSKSYTHRAITIASLAKRSEIFYPLLSGDTEATINAAKCLGATVEVAVEREGQGQAKRILIEGTEGSPDTPEDVINAENSGTTLRFFTAVAALCEGAAVLTGDTSLRKRPNLPLLKALNELGAEAFSTRGDGTAPIVVKGRLTGGKTTIDASISSQFISALLIACPLAAKDSYILANNLSSVPYMRMTTEVLEQAGVEVSFSSLSSSNDYSFSVEGGRSYDLRRFTVPGDFSSSSYLLAAAAITDSELKVKNLFPSAQGDSRIVGLLEEMGAKINWNKEEGIVEVNGTQSVGLRGVKVNMRENPDLVPTIAALAAVAEGSTEITGVAHLRYKETDRLRFLTEELTKMGVRIKEKEDGLSIEGQKKKLKAAKVYSHEDHRLAMALCIAALSARGETVVEEAGCANISYPSFFEDMRDLGADITLS